MAVFTMQLERAAEAYQWGRHEECLELLQQAGSQLEGFSKEQWVVESNLLACMTQRATVAGEVKQLWQIHGQYKALWDRVRGLPPSSDSLPTELVVVCALAQMEVRLRSCSHAVRCCDALTKRVCQHYCLHPCCLAEALPSLVSRLQREHGGAFAVRCLLKLAFCTALLHLASSAVTEGKAILCAIQQALPDLPEGAAGSGVFELVALMKEPVETACNVQCSSVEKDYSEAWQLYCTGCYGEALSTLHSLLQHTSSPPHSTAIARLLAAGCYAHLHKPHLALCSYQQSLASSSNVAVLPALYSCAAMYQRVGNTQAEMEARTLLIEALKAVEDGGEEGGQPLEALLWRGDETVSFWQPQCGGVLETLYLAARRAMQLRRFARAAALFTDITRTVEVGSKALPPSLPTASTLHLLTIQALLCSGEHDYAEQLCSRLVETLQNPVESILSRQHTEGSEEGVEGTRQMLVEILQPPVKSVLSRQHREDSEETRQVLALAQALYFRSSAAVEQRRTREARHCCGRCLKLIQWLQSKEERLPDSMLQCICKVQAHALNTLALLSVGEGHPGHALQLLGEGVCGSHPSLLLVYNHCLLQCRVGRVAEAAQAWLEQREGGVPTGKQAARRRVGEATKRLATLPSSQPEYHYAMMDRAMLNMWLRHCHRMQ